ncbi:MAG TPA: 3'(2'),5'-bisphosphate nucleotidase CysQ [Caulobacterales bacterium]|nr:3'(2'),5'-bisphosphate nucleotidase CysQ [Caulobacterales bacterium]
MPSAASDLLLLEAAAREAGDIARAAFGREVRTWSKGAAGPVTEIDLAIDKLLHAKLTEARPDYGWLSEESADSAERLARARVFVVDPIDGTEAFIAKRPQFTISLGIVENGRAVAGAVFNPIKDEMSLGGDGAPATLNGAPIRVSDMATLEDAHLLGKRAFFDDKNWPRPWPHLRLSFRPSIARRLALVAAGRFDGVILAGFKNEWDIAAGVALVEAAGGRVTDPWGVPLAFNAEVPKAPGLVAAGPKLHALLIERLVTLPDPRAKERQ